MKYFGILWLFSVSSGFPAVPQDAVPSVNLSNDGFIRSNKNLGDVVRYDLGGAAKAKVRCEKTIKNNLLIPSLNFLFLNVNFVKYELND